MGQIRTPEQRRLHRLLGKPSTPLLLKGLHSCIVDEADSLLIDEAVTPLILSAPSKNTALHEAISMAVQLIENLKVEAHYMVYPRFKDVELTAEGNRQLIQMSKSLSGIWKNPSWRVQLVKTALKAREFYKLGQQFVIEKGKMVLVDEFTGRLTPNRNLGLGMHQAVELLHGLEVTESTETIARLSFQKFFRLFDNLSGLTGTAKAAVGEFWRIYELSTVTIPTHRPCRREQKPYQILPNKDLKWRRVLAIIQQVNKRGQPILVGTRSISDSEYLAKVLTTLGLNFQLLNAVNHASESQIVARAGEPCSITIATNLAGRGTRY